MNFNDVQKYKKLVARKAMAEAQRAEQDRIEVSEREYVDFINNDMYCKGGGGSCKRSSKRSGKTKEGRTIEGDMTLK